METTEQTIKRAIATLEAEQWQTEPIKRAIQINKEVLNAMGKAGAIRRDQFKAQG